MQGQTLPEDVYFCGEVKQKAFKLGDRGFASLTLAAKYGPDKAGDLYINEGTYSRSCDDVAKLILLKPRDPGDGGKWCRIEDLTAPMDCSDVDQIDLGHIWITKEQVAAREVGHEIERTYTVTATVVAGAQSHEIAQKLLEGVDDDAVVFRSRLAHFLSGNVTGWVAIVGVQRNLDTEAAPSAQDDDRPPA